ncbi:hypothetical protein [Burkholderia ubonensis]|uniref:hypothetical protein n=1 Tax=Burkholderia ubonensis TaxID=101571 RepID=UPI000B28C152|nr:hypothetical protein [Burkholderia ubonensis]
MKRPTVIRVVVAVVLVPLVAFGAYALCGLSDFELNRSARASTLTFRSGSAELAGTLVLPARVPDATHALLRARWFNYQLESDWPAWKKRLFMSLGRRAYEPGALGMIAGWINAQ